jgi:glycosyltransferase involved in cell wall biosynthesis
LTVNSPFGKGEEFVINEMIALKEGGADLLIIPRDKTEQIYHLQAESLVGNTVIIPWFNFLIAIIFFKYLIINPFLLISTIKDIVFQARNIKIATKNLLILPKAIYVHNLLRNKSVDHIHAHWGTTTSTMAYIIHKLTGLPWSLTLHRWDIKENNLLKIKVNKSLFTRCISILGKKMTLEIIGEEYRDKIKMIPMGVKCPEHFPGLQIKSNGFFRIVVPASLYEVKGHKYLIDACLHLIKKKRVNFRCSFYGDGYLKSYLIKYINDSGLSEYIDMYSYIPNEDLFAMYKKGNVDAVVLPSIHTEDGEHEGIPVSLMEAMAYGIPVISTNTGGISELIGDGSGIMTQEKNSVALADAVEKLMTDHSFYRSSSEKGYHKVQSNFNVRSIADNLLHLFLSGRTI